MTVRTLLFVFVAATLLVLASSLVPGRALVNYPDIDGCDTGCTVAAAGWPFPYVADYPGLSPAGAASLGGAILGEDHLLWTALIADWGVWAVVAGLLAWLVRRRRAQRPRKRRRH